MPCTLADRLGPAAAVPQPQSPAGSALVDALQRQLHSLKSERILCGCKVTVYRAHEHPTATVPTTVHPTAITHAFGPPSPSPWGSRATQTPTSAIAYRIRSREVGIGRRVLATHKLPHHETSCCQLDRDPNHAAKQSQPAASDEICPAACHLQTQSFVTVTSMRS